LLVTDIKRELEPFIDQPLTKIMGAIISCRTSLLFTDEETQFWGMGISRYSRKQNQHLRRQGVAVENY